MKYLHREVNTTERMLYSYGNKKEIIYHETNNWYHLKKNYMLKSSNYL